MKVVGTDRVLLIILLGRSRGKEQGRSRSKEGEIKGMKGKKKTGGSGAERVRPALIPY